MPADTQPLSENVTACNGPIVAIDAVAVTGLRGRELRNETGSERRVCGREWTEPVEDDGYTMYSDRQIDGDTVAITTYGDSAQQMRCLTSSRQKRLVEHYLTSVRQADTAPRTQVIPLRPLELRLTQTDAERARNMNGFEEDRQVASALATSEQVATEVHGLLHNTLDRTKVEESVRALAMINTVVHLLPELYKADVVARERLKLFLGQMGVHGGVSAQYEHYVRTTENYRVPFVPFDVSNEPTVLALKQRLYAAGHMLGGGQFECAHAIALKRTDLVSQLLAETQHEDGLATVALMRGVSDKISECKEKVSDLAMQLSLVRAQY